MPSRLLFLAVLTVVCTTWSGAPQHADRARPPSLLLLLADDQRPDTVGAWGNEAIETPHLDRLVAEGFSFRRAYCLGSPHGAVCVPSRAMLHTGRAWFGLDLSSFAGRPTLGELLGARGYATRATGKWHNGKDAFRRSFERGRAVFFGGMCDHTAVPLVDLEEGEYRDERVGEGHSSELFADAAIELLADLDPELPFFLYVAFTAPHDPRDPPERWRERYTADRPPLPASFRGQHPFDTGFLRVRDEQLAGWPRTREVVADQLAEYYGLISHLDAQVGRVLAALEARPDATDTVVVYAADHGLALGSHGLLGKQSCYEHSLGLPLVVRGPGIPAGGASDALVYLHDLYPTLLGLAGVEPPGDLHAADLAPVWRGERTGVRASLFTSMGTTIRAVRDERWKLVRYPAVDHTQLFDLERDPDELVNLAAEPEQAERAAALRRELEAWQTRVGDDLPWTAAETKPLRVDLTGAARRPDRWQPAWIRAKYFGE